LSSKAVASALFLAAFMTSSAHAAETAQRMTSVSDRGKCGRQVAVTEKTCQKEFEAWQAREKKWRENRQTFGNYARYQGLTIPYVKRPDPPAWVPAYCGRQSEDDHRATAVCEAYENYLQYDWTQHIEGPQPVVTYANRAVQPSGGDLRGFREYLLRNLHYDAVWTNGWAKPKAFGLFGTHLTLARTGRFYLWGPPGMLVISRPRGKLDLKMTWGVDVFIADLPNPFLPGRKLSIYGSVAKVFGKRENTLIQKGVNAGMNMAGLSITLAR